MNTFVYRSAFAAILLAALLVRVVQRLGQLDAIFLVAVSP